MEDNTELKEECGIVLAASFSAQDKFDHDTVEAAMTFAMQGLNSGIRTLVIVCAGLVGDICRGFGESFEPFADSTMELFVNLCQVKKKEENKYKMSSESKAGKGRRKFIISGYLTRSFMDGCIFALYFNIASIFAFYLYFNIFQEYVFVCV
eukprot:m.168821 g.168821  ORF g.168821 m.168821 type:complete len:151 (+) comp25090_c0_seq8:111-563(+)